MLLEVAVLFFSCVTTPHMEALLLLLHIADKTERMRAMIAYYIKGDEHALDRFPGGSEPGS